MSTMQQENPTVEDVRAILATIMAHGCNIGPYTMSHMIQGVSYHRIKQISDWMLSEDSQRAALAVVVNAISKLDITPAWGSGKASSSDGQRFAMRRKVLQQTYSPKFKDFAIEFYTFVADNYAPFFSLPVECTDRSHTADILEAVTLLRDMNDQKKRKLPEDIPISFIPQRLLPFVVEGGIVDKASWECSLLLTLRDTIKSGNLSVGMSKRFGRFDDFFIPEKQWESERESFFSHAGLPVKANEVPRYLTRRLNQAFDQFLETLPDNAYVTIKDHGWRLASDAHGTHSAMEKRMAPLKEWLSANMRTVKLPELLIEVDNDRSRPARSRQRNMEKTIEVFPVPGPPVMTTNLFSKAKATATFCSAARGRGFPELCKVGFASTSLTISFQSWGRKPSTSSVASSGAKRTAKACSSRRVA